MSDHSNIEWTDATWNPVVGCMKVSDGCTNCYAIDTAYRLEHAFKQPSYAGTTRKLPDGSRNWTGLVRCLPERLADPLKWRKPRRIFVTSMADLFHEDVPDEFIVMVFATMAIATQHTFQVLTKRPERMLALLGSSEFLLGLEIAVRDVAERSGWPCADEVDDWPLQNVWLGVSVEDQRAAEERIPLLLQTPAAIRWLSCEPLLGLVTLRPGRWVSPIGGGPRVNLSRPWETPGPVIDWVVAGGESGAKARSMDIDWARSLRDECQATGVAFYFKQVGGRTHAAGGRVFDGRLWDEYPESVRELVVPGARE